MDFLNYLQSNDIIIVKNFSNIEKRNYSDEDIKNHLDLIGKVQIILKNYDPKYFYSFKSFVWKKPENFNKNLKTVKKFYNKLLENGPKNEYENIILNVGHILIRRAEICNEELKSSKYKSLIKRSMTNKEITLGKVNYDNLKQEEKIKIIDIKSIGYNMLEMDAIQFLSKIKKKIPYENIPKYCKYYCEIKDLTSLSVDFIITMLSYPSKFIKNTKRYFENKAYYEQNVHIDKFKNAILQDGESLYEFI